MTRGSSLRLDHFFGGALLVMLGAGLLPACGGGGHGGGGAGAGGQGAGGAGGSPLVGACGFAEPEPNDTRDLATPYVLGTSVVACLGAADDVDLYSFTAPAADLAGGYVMISFTEVGVGALDVQLYSGADNSAIGGGAVYKTTDGASIYMYLAVAPGTPYRIGVQKFAGGSLPFRYTLKAVYTPLADAYEPNDTKDTAKPIALATPITAFQAAGYVTDPFDGLAYSDWYSVSLAVGTVTIKMSNVPTDISGDVTLFDPEGASAGEKYTTDDGANVTFTADVTVAGVYKISVFPFAGGPPAAGEAALMMPADHLTRPYTFLVTQP